MRVRSAERRWIRRRRRQGLDPARFCLSVADHVEAALHQERRIRTALARVDVPVGDVESDVDALMSDLAHTAELADAVTRHLADQDLDGVERRIGHLRATAFSEARLRVAAALAQQLA